MVFDQYKPVRTKIIKTGIEPIDMVCGGGFETGATIEFAADSGLGKTTVIMHIVLNLVKKGLRVLYLDLEGGIGNSVEDEQGNIRPTIAENLGLTEYPPELFEVLTPDTAADVHAILDTLLKQNYKPSEIPASAFKYKRVPTEEAKALATSDSNDTDEEDDTSTSMATKPKSKAKSKAKSKSKSKPKVETISNTEFKYTYIKDESQTVPINPCNNCDYDVVVVDSISVLKPDYLAEEGNNIRVGGNSSTIAEFFLKYKSQLKKKNIILIVVSHMITSIQTVGFRTITSLVSKGGKSIKYYPDIRIKFEKFEDIKKKELLPTQKTEVDVPIGIMLKVSTQKCRYARSQVPILCPMIYGRGYSPILFYKEVLTAMGFLTSAGASFKCKMGDLEFTALGTVKLREAIMEHGQEIKDYLNQHNLLSLVRSVE